MELGEKCTEGTFSDILTALSQMLQLLFALQPSIKSVSSTKGKHDQGPAKKPTSSPSLPSSSSSAPRPTRPKRPRISLSSQSSLQSSDNATTVTPTISGGSGSPPVKLVVPSRPSCCCSPGRHRHPGGDCCYLCMLPMSVLIDCIGKRWVMWPERRVLVQFTPISIASGSCAYEKLFFSVSPTLGIVHEPVRVSLDPDCIGWLGGNELLVRRKASGLDNAGMYHFGAPMTLRSSDSVEVEGFKACGNKNWIVVAGSAPETKDSGLFVYGMKNSKPELQNLLRYPWFDSVLSLGFFGSTEYDFESDVVEAIFIEKKGADEILCVAHINLNSIYGSADPLQVIGVCNLTERETEGRSITKPLVNRADRTYCFVLETIYAVNALVLNTGRMITLHEVNNLELDTDCAMDTVDESHLCMTRHISSVSSIYPLSELLRVASSSPISPSILPSSEGLQQMTPCRVVPFPPGSFITAGCGILITSSVLMHKVPNKVILRSPHIYEDNDPDTPYHFPVVAMHQKFVDSTTGTVLFTMKRTDPILVANDIRVVPFPAPLEKPSGKASRC
ncbi:hypothetical protein Pelo_13999 [Pelomyxa schiedti]|nr:hypothetical protein Pelo_13999 [Pelomyxa schiedti]